MVSYYDTWLIFSRISDFNFANSLDSIRQVGINKFDFILSPLVILLLLLIEFFSSNKKEEYVFQSLTFYKKVFAMTVIGFCILIFGIEDSNQFIYFQF